MAQQFCVKTELGMNLCKFLNPLCLHDDIIYIPVTIMTRFAATLHELKKFLGRQRQRRLSVKHYTF